MTRVPGLTDLLWLAEHAADITEAQFKGTPRSWRQRSALSPDQQLEQDERAAAERADRNVLAIGEHPAPMHVDVFDVLLDLLTTADDLAERVAQAAGVERLPPASSAMADPEPYLRHAAQHLVAAYEADYALSGYVQERAAQLKALVSTHLGLVLDGQTVPGLCPWCSGGMAQRPSLRIRLVKPAPTIAPVPAAVCESGICEPPEADVGLWHGTRPAWPLDTEGTWLSKRMRHHAENGPKCRCGEPLLPTGKGGQRRRYCSAACRREADAERKRDAREAS